MVKVYDFEHDVIKDIGVPYNVVEVWKKEVKP